MICGMDFKPVIERISLEQGDGQQYASHVAEIIDEILTSFITQLYEAAEFSIIKDDILYEQASISINEWLKSMRSDVNNKNQSVTWAKNILVLLVKTLDSVKDWHPYLDILDKRLMSILPKHYK